MVEEIFLCVAPGAGVFVDRRTSEVKVGDVVTFFRPDNVRENVTHRIASLESKEEAVLYKTKGDANNAEDIWTVRRDAMWGKVVFHIPWLGFLMSFTKTRPGVLLVVVLPLLIIAIDELRVIIQEIRRIRAKKSKNSSPRVVTTTALLH